MIEKNTELVIATHNPFKIKEYKSLFSDSSINIRTAIGLGEPEENGKTFTENAYIKAKNGADYTEKLSLGEDSGLVINALDNFPGIRTGRWAKDLGSYRKAFESLKEKLNGLPTNASFQCSIVLFCPKQGQVQEFSESVSGSLDFSFIDGKGFGYDPIFVPEGYDKPFSQLDPSIKNKISHRAKCCAKLLQFLHSTFRT